MQVTLLALLLSVSLALGCQQAVVLVRHGEDAEKGMGNLPLPDVMFPGSICGGPRMPRYDMVEEGTERATLLRDHLDGWMTELGLCPIDRVSTVDPVKLDNGMSPTVNPYATILPYANARCDKINRFDYYVNQAQVSTSAGVNGSRVISHTSQGFWGNDKSRLFPDSRNILRRFFMDKNQFCFPLHQIIYVFTDFDLLSKTYKTLQQFNMPDLNCTGDACKLIPGKTSRNGSQYCPERPSSANTLLRQSLK